MSDDEELTARELIVGIRGGIPAKCDFCEKETLPQNLHPEEAGEWVCIDCMRRWEKEELLKNPNYIVSEMTVNWANGEMNNPTEGLISQRFEKILNVNAERGYKLHSYTYHTSIPDSSSSMIETIIAIFKREERAK